MYGRRPFFKKKKVFLSLSLEKGGNSGKFGCLTNSTSFPPPCGFCLLKNFESSVIMTSRCDLPVTEWRMNGHVKSLQFQLWMEAATSKWPLLGFRFWDDDSLLNLG